MRTNVRFFRDRLTTFRAMSRTTRTNNFLEHNELLSLLFGDPNSRSGGVDQNRGKPLDPRFSLDLKNG